MKRQRRAYSVERIVKRMRTFVPCHLSAIRFPLSAGFTLIELMVAVGLFAIVMTVSTGALLSLVAANRKAQALQAVMNNLNITLDGMVRSIRMGSVYHCGNGPEPRKSPQDCPDGADFFVFQPYGNDPTDNPTMYQFQESSHSIRRSVDGGSFMAITAPEVEIEDVRFYVVGSTSGDPIQPKVVIVIKGTAGGDVGAKEHSTFHIEATAVQRQPDI